MMSELLASPPTGAATAWPIEARGLTKAFGTKHAVRDLSFTVAPGSITGFLGPNGAGKSTTLRMLFGLQRPSAGRAFVAGRPFAQLRRPATVVGAALDAHAFEPTRSARDHLRVLASIARLDASSVERALAEVELTADAGRRVREYSLGMKQRLALAAALIGEPSILVLDEPANGLDPPGMRWLRDFLAGFAARGGTVLLSSHLLAEISQLAHDLIVINRGELVAAGATEALIGGSGTTAVRTPDAERLVAALEKAGIVVTRVGEELLAEADAAVVGELAARARVVLHSLTPSAPSLEDAFLRLIGGGR